MFEHSKTVSQCMSKKVMEYEPYKNLFVIAYISYKIANNLNFKCPFH